MGSEDKVLEELKKQAGDSIVVDEGKFKNEEEMKEINKKDLSSLGDLAEGIDPGFDIPSLSIEERMEKVGMSKDTAIDMILMLSDDGFIKEEVKLFGGKFKATFKTAKITDSKRFVEIFDEMNVNTQAKAEYYLNLYALASILVEFNGKEVDHDDDVTNRAEWVEENIPVPIYKALLAEANKFHEKIELLNSKEVADFF